MSTRPEVAAVARIGGGLSPLRRQTSSLPAKRECADAWGPSRCARCLDSCLRRN